MAGNLSGNLPHNILLFGRLLRGLGLDINPGRVMDLLHALEYIEIGREADFFHASCSLLVHRHSDIPLFSKAFELFWRNPSVGVVKDLDKLLHNSRPDKPVIIPPSLTSRRESYTQNDFESAASDIPSVIECTPTYSALDVLRRKNFAELTVEELAAIKRLMADLVWRLGQRRTRRRKIGRGQLLDMRRTVRHNLKYGGEILYWARREPKFKPRPVVLIADISGSMERYSRLLLHFLYSLAEGLAQQVETFVFGTRLTRITRQVRGYDVDHALWEVSQSVQDWAGGTRIGEALKTFNFDWRRCVISRGAVVMLISDGWDCGDPDLLRAEIARLQRNCYRLIWLNPLLGSPEYEPLTRGMKTALPYIDNFLPVHNLLSLEDLAAHLEQLSVARPMRRQQALVRMQGQL